MYISTIGTYTENNSFFLKRSLVIPQEQINWGITKRLT